MPIIRKCFRDGQFGCMGTRRSRDVGGLRERWGGRTGRGGSAARMLHNSLVHLFDEVGIARRDHFSLELERRRHHPVLDGEGVTDKAEVSYFLRG